MNAPVRLDDFGDVLSEQDVERLIQRGRGYLAYLRRQERKAGVRLTPRPIEGLGWRYTKDEIRRWLKVGAAGRRLWARAS